MGNCQIFTRVRAHLKSLNRRQGSQLILMFPFSPPSICFSNREENKQKEKEKERERERALPACQPSAFSFIFSSTHTAPVDAPSTTSSTLDDPFVRTSNISDTKINEMFVPAAPVCLGGGLCKRDDPIAAAVPSLGRGDRNGEAVPAGLSPIPGDASHGFSGPCRGLRLQVLAFGTLVVPPSPCPASRWAAGGAVGGAPPASCGSLFRDVREKAISRPG